MADNNPYSSLIPQENPYMKAMSNEIPKTEGFLQKAINAAGVGIRQSHPGQMMDYYAPKNMDEAKDLGRSITNIIPEAPLQNDPLKEMGVTSWEEPKTDYGQRMKMMGQVIPLAVMGLEGATSGMQGISKLFSTGSLPEDINATKGNIEDIINTGPGKVKQSVQGILREANRAFEEKLSNIAPSQNMSHKDFSDILLNTAHDYGNAHVEGTPGNFLLNKATEFAANGNKVMTAPEVQANYRQVLGSLGDEASKATWNNQYGAALEQTIPELAQARSEHAPVYDIARQSKQITKGSLRSVASGKAGPEQLGRMTQAQQMMGDNPNVVEQADAAGRKLGQQKNDLEKIIGRQNNAKKIGWTAAKTVGIEELIRHFLPSKSSN